MTSSEESLAQQRLGPRARWRRGPVLLAVAALLAAAGVLVGRVAVDSRAALRSGLAAEARGASAEAIRGYFDAARLYLPGSPWVRQAIDRLDALAGTAEAKGDLLAARHALEAIRAASLGTRSFYTPHAARLPGVERRLAHLYALTEMQAAASQPPAAGEPGRKGDGGGHGDGDSLEIRQAWHAARLARHPGPALPYALLALAGLALWLGAAVGFIRRGLDRGLRLRRGPAIAAGVLFAVGFALFLAGLRLA